MKHTLHKINGLSVMVLSIIGITLVVTTHFVDAQTTTKTVVQPKIASLKIISKISGTQKTTALSWPRDAGKITDLDPNTTQIQLNPALQKGYNQRTYWAFRYVWSDEAPTMASFMTDSKIIAERFFTAANFGTQALSPVVKINTEQNRNKYLTIYAFVTNKDRTSGARDFPLGIDYVAATTYHIPEKSELVEAAKNEEIIVAPKPIQDEWADVDTKAGYQE